MNLEFDYMEIVPYGETEPVKLLTDIYCDNPDEVTEIEIPEGVVTVFDSVFPYFKNLKRVILHEGLKDFGSFEGLTEIEEINLPSTVNSIGEDAFRDCSSLTSLTIPAAIVSIANCPFVNSGIKELRFLGIDNLKRIENAAFAGTYEGVNFILPTSTEKKTVPYTADMGTPVLTEGYRERMAKKSILEQAKALRISHESYHNTLEKFESTIRYSTYADFAFIDDWAKVDSLILDDGILVGYNIRHYKGSDDAITPLLIGVPTCLSYDVSYVHTGDNNGAGYKGDDDDNSYSTPEYKVLFEMGALYPFMPLEDEE